MPDDGLGEGGPEQKCQGGPSPYFFILEKFYLLKIFFFWAQGGLGPPLPCTFVQMALCIYERSLFSMYSYHCGKNLDIYMIVVNRSSNLS